MSPISAKLLGTSDLGYGLEKHLKKQPVNWVSIHYINKLSYSQGILFLVKKEGLSSVEG